jgi:nicotinamidase-related amidase
MKHPTHSLFHERKPTMNSALLLIDLQNDYFPSGAMVLDGSIEAGARAAELLGAFRRAGRPVIHVQHCALQPGATFFLPGTAGMAIHSGVAPQAGECVIEKHYPNSFRDTALLATLKAQGVDELVMAGMMTHMCVDATVRAAFDLGFRCQVAGDACATRALHFNGAEVPAAQVQGAFLAALHGVYAMVGTAAEMAG